MFIRFTQSCFCLAYFTATDLPNGDLQPPQQNSDVNNDGVPRSASYPSMTSIPDGMPDVVSSSPRPRSSVDETLEDHDRAHRTISDPVTQSARIEQPGLQNISPSTPTDTMSAPITYEQLSEATHQARPKSLADVESIECLYSIEEVATPSGEEQVEGASGGEHVTNRPTHLQLDIAEPKTTEEDNHEISTQTTLPPASIQEGSSTGQDQSDSLDSPVITVTTSDETMDDDEDDLSPPLSACLGHDNIVSESSSGELSSEIPMQDNEDEDEEQTPVDRTLSSPSRSPEARRRALSDIILKQEIEEEVERLRKRTISSGNTTVADEGENVQCTSGAAESDLPNTTQTTDKVTVQSSEGAVAVVTASSVSLSPTRHEGARQKQKPLAHKRVKSGKSSSSSSSSAGQRNNNNSLAQPSTDRNSGENQSQQASAEDHVMDQQPDNSSSVSISDSTPATYNNKAGGAAAAMGSSSRDAAAAVASASSGATVSESSELDTPPEASGGRMERSENGSTRSNDAVWQRRRRVRSAAPSLRGKTC